MTELRFPSNTTTAATRYGHSGARKNTETPFHAVSWYMSKASILKGKRTGELENCARMIYVGQVVITAVVETIFYFTNPPIWGVGNGRVRVIHSHIRKLCIARKGS